MINIIKPILVANSNPILHHYFSIKIPRYLKHCLGMSVLLHYSDQNQKNALASNTLPLDKPFGKLAISFDNRNSALLHIPITLEPIAFDGALDYDIFAPISPTAEICGHFQNLSENIDFSNLNLTLTFKLT